MTGLSPNAKKTAEIASSVQDTDGVLFIPSFSGIQVKISLLFVTLKPISTVIFYKGGYIDLIVSSY